MPTREEIREGIALTYLQWKKNDTTLQLKDIDAFLRSECLDFADEIMKQEASQGVVIKAGYTIKYSTAIPAGTELAAVESLI